MKFIFLFIIWNFSFLALGKPLNQWLYEDLQQTQCPETTLNEIQNIKCLSKTSTTDFKNLDETSEAILFSNLKDTHLKASRCQSMELQKLISLTDVKSQALQTTCTKLDDLKMTLDKKSCLERWIDGYENILEAIPNNPEKRKKYSEALKQLKQDLIVENEKIQIYRQTDTLLSSPTVYKKIAKWIQPTFKEKILHRVSDPLNKTCLKSSMNAKYLCGQLKKHIESLLREDLQAALGAQKKISQIVSFADNDLKTELWNSSARNDLLEKIQDPQTRKNIYCRMNARYGAGADYRNRLITLASFSIPTTLIFTSGLKIAPIVAQALAVAGTVGSSHQVYSSCWKEHLDSLASPEACQKMTDSDFRSLFYKKQKSYNCQIASAGLVLNMVGVGATFKYFKSPQSSSSHYQQKTLDTFEFGKHKSSMELPTNQPVNLIVWNVHKGANSQLPSDFSKMSSSANFASMPTSNDIVLFQEAVNSTRFTENIVGANPQLGWNMVNGWSKKGIATGVATASKVKPMKQVHLVSTVTEPISKTPKTALITEYAIAERSERLMVVNIHAINFVKDRTFQTHIMQVVEHVKAHQGPMIFAGDFNTWSPLRMKFLQSHLAKIGLEKIPISQKKIIQLDHIFIREMKTQKVNYNTQMINSSDHKPLNVILEFK